MRVNVFIPLALGSGVGPLWVLMSCHLGPWRVPREQTHRVTNCLGLGHGWGTGSLGILFVLIPWFRFDRLHVVGFDDVTTDSGLRFVASHLEMPILGEFSRPPLAYRYPCSAAALVLLRFPSVERGDFGSALVGPNGAASKTRHHWAA